MRSLSGVGVAGTCPSKREALSSATGVTFDMIPQALRAQRQDMNDHKALLHLFSGQWIAAVADPQALHRFA